MKYPIKIEFKQFPLGVYVDWSAYLVDDPTISKKTESETPGESGVIAFDKASVTLYYIAGNPVFNAFDPSVITLNSTIRYLFKISAPKSDGTYVQMFEGMADFSTIQWPEFGNEITFDVLDKLSALSILPIDLQRPISIDVIAERGDPTATMAQIFTGKGSNGVFASSGHDWAPFGANGDEAIIVTFQGDVTQFWGGYPTWAGSVPLVNRGETISIIYGGSTYIVKDAWIDYVPSSLASALGYNVTATWVRLTPGIIAGTSPSNNVLALGTPSVALSNYYDEVAEYIDILNPAPDANGRYNVLSGFDVLKIIQAIVNHVWPAILITNLSGVTSYPIPVSSFIQLINENPFGLAPVDAIKTIAASMQCYIYINKAGNLVIQKKASLGNNGTSRSIGTTKIFSKTKLYFWDKLNDGATVKVTSWEVDSTGNSLVGMATATMQFPGSTAAITPKNPINQDFFASNTGVITDSATLNYENALIAFKQAYQIYLTGHDQTRYNIATNTYNLALLTYQGLLNNWALSNAQSVLSFYGVRHSAIDITLQLDDNTIDWEVLDNLIDADGVQYFFTQIDFSLAERTITLNPIVEVAGHSFDIRQIVIGLSESNAISNFQSNIGGSSSVPSSSIGNSTIGTIYPEDYGALGDGTADDTTAIISAIKSSKGKTLLLSAGTYKVTSTINVSLGGDSIKIIGRNNSTIHFTNTASAGTYDAPDGCLVFDGGQVDLQGITLTGTNAGIPPNDGSSGNALSLLQISNCTSVSLNNIVASYGIYCGIQIINCKNLLVENCIAQYNNYAGLLVRGTTGSQIIGGNYSYNGYNAPYNGYGVTFSGRFPYPAGSTPIDNTNILITGITANFNKRKGIDIHGGVNVQIIGNNIKGFGYYGIYAVDENGNAGYEKYVKDVIIQGNIVENDLAFYTSLGITWNIEPINVGSYSYGLPDLFLAPGSFIVESNIIRNCDMPGARSMILVFVGNAGTPIDAVHIRNNIIMNAVIGYPGDGAIMVAGPSLNPRLIDISGNTIDGNSASSNTNGAGITVLAGELVTVHDNNIRGTWGGGAVNVANVLHQRVYNNITNNLGLSPSDSASISLPDMYSQGSGIFRLNIETSSIVPLTMDILTIDSQFYNSGSTTIDLIVRITTANMQANIIYRYVCYIGNNSGVESYATFHTETDEIVGDSTVSPPAVVWSTGTGSIHTLQISCGLAYTNYSVEAKVGAWRLITNPFN